MIDAVRGPAAINLDLNAGLGINTEPNTPLFVASCHATQYIHIYIYTYTYMYTHVYIHV